MNNLEVLQLFECCRLVKGALFGSIVDLQRKSYRRIPNELVTLINNAIGKTRAQIKAIYNEDFCDVIEENIDFLITEEYMFFTSNPEWFPAMSLEWEEVTAVTNGIIDIKKNSDFDFGVLWMQYSKLGCEHIQIRAFDQTSILLIEDYLDKIQSLRIVSVEIIMPYDKVNTEQMYIDLVQRQPRVFSIILYSAPENKIVNQSSNGMGQVYLSKDVINSESHCGVIDTDLFSIHIKSYTESLRHNSCLNRKISIDTEGNIKNCPSMKESYGNIRDTTLAEAIEKPGFKKYWNLNKDEIHVCKDCEFRHICTDCRAYVEDPEDILSKPLKCGYNPYTGKWSEWSTNPLKQKAIDFYGFSEVADILEE